MRIEQMLHGYDNGHRLLAGSVMLKSKVETDLITILSDWSEYDNMEDSDSSYMTAYPLIESGYYIFAKTWYANEMKRPGCVWTHSLLIPFNELDVINDFKQLIRYFKRPKLETALDTYSSTIEYDNCLSTELEPIIADRCLTVNILDTFIKNTQFNVFFNKVRDNSLIDVLMLAIMNMLPSTMICRISWCTGAAYLRKINDIPLTCQFLSKGGNNSDDISVMEEEKWQTYVVDAILNGNVNKGQILRVFATDIGSNENKYHAIINILSILEDYFNTNTKSNIRFKEVLGIVAMAFPHEEEGIIIKKLCANKIFSDKYCVEQLFLYYCATLPLDGVFNIKETGIENRLNNFIIDNREQYIQLLKFVCHSKSINNWGLCILEQSANILTSKEVTNFLKYDDHTFNTLLILNPSLLNNILWHDVTIQDMEAILPLVLDKRIQKDFSEWGTLFGVLLNFDVGISEQLAEEIFRREPNAASQLLDYVNNFPEKNVCPTLVFQLKSKTLDVLKWLKRIDKITENVAYIIIGVVNEHSELVIMMGANTWHSFLGLRLKHTHIRIYTFLFVLSFNWPLDLDALELLRMSFFPLHTFQSKKMLGYNEWSYIAPYMEPVMIWDEWDKCKKMRKTVIKRLKDAEVDRDSLMCYTPDNELNEMLIKMW